MTSTSKLTARPPDICAQSDVLHLPGASSNLLVTNCQVGSANATLMKRWEVRYIDPYLT
jgi:hypothetical protein